jgi:hypothetical protein
MLWDACSHCENMLVVTLKGGKLEVTAPNDENQIKKVMEKCPNCGTTLETWIHPNLAVVRIYGAKPTSNPLNYICEKCEFEIAYAP